RPFAQPSGLNMSDDTPSTPADAPAPDAPVESTEPVATAVAEPEPETVAAEPPAEEAAEETPVPTAEPPAEASKKKWYVVKVASGREESIKAAIERMVKIEGLEEFLGQIVIPVERVTEVKKVKETKNGEKITREKRVVKEKKKFPGYLMAEVEWNPDIQTLFRDTSGVGDFVGSTGPGKEPAPMSPRDVQAMLYGMLPEDQKGSVKAAGPEKVKLDFEQGDKVRIREGAFATFEGDVKLITMPKEAGETPKVTVVVKVFGRDVDVVLEYWQVDKV
ncbi:MAG: transcription termination/antitermination NusG family protein, partial [Gemmataceae bacterium]